MDSGLFAPVDFAEAFDSVSHVYASAFFRKRGLLPGHTRMLLFLFQAPLRLILPAGICQGHDFCPNSGVRHGYPLSPLVLFALLIWPIIQPLHAVACPVRVVVYADDVMLVFSC